MKKLGYVMICSMMLGSTISGFPMATKAMTQESTVTETNRQPKTNEVTETTETNSSTVEPAVSTSTTSSTTEEPAVSKKGTVQLRYGIMEAGKFIELAAGSVHQGVVGTAFDFSAKTFIKEIAGYELDPAGMPVLKGTFQEAPQTLDFIYNELPQAAPSAAPQKAAGLITYSTLIQGSGWKQGTDGSASGVLKDTHPIQKIKIDLAETEWNANLHYQTRSVNGQWSSYVSGGQEIGEGSQGLEAVRLYLDGALAEKYDIWYQTKVKGFGWMKWVKGGTGQLTGNDGASGTGGLGYSINGIKLQLVEKGKAGPKAAATDKKHSYIEQTKVSYTTKLIGSTNFQNYSTDGKTSGNLTANKKIEAIKIKADNDTLSGGIDYRTHVAQKGWQAVVKNNQVSGLPGQKLQVEAMKVALTGELKEYFDVYYRSYVQGYGWLGWTSNGEESGTVGLSYGTRAYEVSIRPKGTQAPEGATQKPVIKNPKIEYQSHVSYVGWQTYKKDGTVSGTTGQKRRIEALRIKRGESSLTGEIQYTTHVQNKGWMSYSTENKLSGTTGEGLQVEALKVRLTGELGQYFDVYYRSHIQNVGWLDWAKNDEISGSTGMKYRVEAVQVKLVPKGGAAPGSTKRKAVKKPALSYASHVQRIGWQNYRGEGVTSGTTGRALRVEALKMKVEQSGLSGSIQYASHVSKKGWQGYKANNAISGTTGKALSVEAIRVRLTGELAKHFDVYYRVHAQNFGWMGWAKNGANAGTSKYAYHIEAVQVKLVRKGAGAPGSTANPYKVKSNRRSAADVLGTTKARIVKELSSHQNDRFYQGTPFRGGAFFDQTYSMSPNGNPNKYGPGMNCTGFVAAVFNQAGAPIRNVTKIANRSGGVTNAYNWRDALKTTGNYYVYPSIDKFLASGKAEKGDIIYFEADFSRPFYDCHIGFYWGNHKGDNKMWHSTGRYSNAISHMFSGTPYSAVYLFKL